MKKLFLFILLMYSSATMMAQNKKFFINSKQADCTGVGPMKCLQFKEKKDDAWKFLYQPIEGFDFEPGYLYTLKIKQTTIANPPADGSSVRYTLKKVISKEKDPAMAATSERNPSGKWTLISLLKNDQLEDVSAKAFQLELNADGKVVTKICNRIMGTYTYANGSIRFSGMTSTRMTCPEMPYESAFNQAINEVDNVVFERNKMILKKGEKVLLVLSEPI